MDQKRKSRRESTGTQKMEAGHVDQKRRSRGEPIGTKKTEARHGGQRSGSWREIPRHPEDGGQPQ